jgi:acyl carrier protein
MSEEPSERARKLVAEAVERPLGDIPPDAAIDTLPAWDSLAHVRIVLALEAAVGAPLQTDQIVDLRSVADVAAILSRYR